MAESVKKSNRWYLPAGINLLCFVIFAGTAIFLRFQVKPFRRGFFCEDISIRYPYLPTTIRTSVMLPAILFISAAVIFGVEFFRRSAGAASVSFFCLRVPAYILHAFRIYLFFVWGVVATVVLTDIIKVSLGTLRPNFWAICQPNITCTNPSENGIYHTNYYCTRASEEKEIFTRTSFPSGHTSQAIYAAIFLIIFLQKRLSAILTNQITPFLQLCLISGALWSATTRVTDNAHHLEDVIAGLILGFSVGVAVGLQCLGWIRRQESATDKPHEVVGDDEAEKHLATLQSDLTASERLPNGQV